jgi:hypothetical protein
MKCQCSKKCIKEVEPVDCNRNSVMIGSRQVLRKYSKECAKKIQREKDLKRTRKRVNLSELAFGS